MGGGGGGTFWSPDSEKKIKEELEKARDRRNLFISFAYEDLDDVNLFRGQAKNERSDIDFIDRSVKKRFASVKDDYIKQQITRRIKQASMTAVYLSEHSVKSKWVKWEVETSIKHGRDVIAFYSGPKKPTHLPKIIDEKKIKVCSWADLKIHLK